MPLCPQPRRSPDERERNGTGPLPASHAIQKQSDIEHVEVETGRPQPKLVPGQPKLTVQPQSIAHLLDGILLQQRTRVALPGERGETARLQQIVHSSVAATVRTDVVDEGTVRVVTSAQSLKTQDSLFNSKQCLYLCLIPVPDGVISILCDF